MQDQLRQCEERNHDIISQQIDPICRLTPQLTLSFVNQPYAELFNTTPDEMLGKSILSFIPEEDHARVLAHFASIDASNPVSLSENQMILANGKVQWFEWRDRAIMDTVGQLIEYQGVGRDITERKYLAFEQQTTLDT